MKIITLSEEDFFWLRNKEEKKIAAIRIYNHPEELEDVGERFERIFKEVMPMYFGETYGSKEKDGYEIESFGKKQQEQLKKFIERNKDCEEIYIHCKMGKVRSAGVAMGLKEKYPKWEVQNGRTGKDEVYPDRSIAYMVEIM